MDGAGGLSRDGPHGGRDGGDGVGGTHHVTHLAHVEVAEPTVGPTAKKDKSRPFWLVHDGRLPSFAGKGTYGEGSAPGVVSGLKHQHIVEVAALRVAAFVEVTAVASEDKDFPIGYLQ